MNLAAILIIGASACHVVNDDVIRMRDVAGAEPAFSAIGDDAIVAYAPTPGAIRTLQAAQLKKLAQRGGSWDGEFRDVCFERAMRRLNEQELIEAFQQSLGIPNAAVELVDFSRFPAPVGALVFPRSGLAVSPSTTLSQGWILWKGYVIYGDGHHFPVWARVKITVRLNRVVATDNLVTRQPIRADQVRIEPLEGTPDALAPAQSIEEVVGKVLLHPVRKGATVSLDDLSTAVVVRRGDRVDVDLQAPSIHVRLEAVAEMDGRVGDQIRVRNMQNGNHFEAEVSGKDQARVLVEEERSGSIDSASLGNTGYPGSIGSEETQRRR